MAKAKATSTFRFLMRMKNTMQSLEGTFGQIRRCGERVGSFANMLVLGLNMCCFFILLAVTQGSTMLL
jgi:hypothetical protein